MTKIYYNDRETTTHPRSAVGSIVQDARDNGIKFQKKKESDGRDLKSMKLLQ
jgi:hypothetical protein